MIVIIVNLLIRSNTSESAQQLVDYTKLNIAIGLRSNSLNMIYNGLFSIVQMNKGTNYFINYDDHMIKTEAYRIESIKYFKLGIQGLEHHNRLIYKTINQLKAKKVLLEISLTNDVTLYFQEGQDKNFTLI